MELPLPVSRVIVLSAETPGHPCRVQWGRRAERRGAVSHGDILKAPLSNPAVRGVWFETLSGCREPLFLGRTPISFARLVSASLQATQVTRNRLPEGVLVSHPELKRELRRLREQEVGETGNARNTTAYRTMPTLTCNHVCFGSFK